MAHGARRDPQGGEMYEKMRGLQCDDGEDVREDLGSSSKIGFNYTLRGRD